MEKLDVDKRMKKGIIYYTDNKLDEPIFSIVQKQISKANLPIVSVSLEPMALGKNIVLEGEPRCLMIVKQIITALENSEADIVFFCEHDVLYHLSHFDFTPPTNDKFYYNTNNWRWLYPKDLAITYDILTSLSALSVYRKLALEHYKKRLELIYRKEWDNDKSREPYWARRMGHEPGTKSKRQELIPTNGCEYWKSEYPNIDIRHGKTLSKTKCSLGDFKHKPENWQETKLNGIKGWNLKRLFNLENQ